MKSTHKYSSSEIKGISTPSGTAPQPVQMTVRHATSAETAAIPSDALKAVPFFGSFADSSICATNGVVTITQALRAQLLADAIPAESFAAGRNMTGGVAGNYNYQGEGNMPNGWPRKDRRGDPLWYHSDIKDVPFFFTYPFFIRAVKGNSP